MRRAKSRSAVVPVHFVRPPFSWSRPLFHAPSVQQRFAGRCQQYRGRRISSRNKAFDLMHEGKSIRSVVVYLAKLPHVADRPQAGILSSEMHARKPMVAPGLVGWIRTAAAFQRTPRTYAD